MASGSIEMKNSSYEVDQGILPLTCDALILLGHLVIRLALDHVVLSSLPLLWDCRNF